MRASHEKFVQKRPVLILSRIVALQEALVSHPQEWRSGPHRRGGDWQKQLYDDGCYHIQAHKLAAVLQVVR